MPRRAPRRDTNEAAIVRALEAVGATVQRLDAPGVPDLLIGFRGSNYLIECKSTTYGPARARRFTPDQRSWLLRWRGQRAVVTKPSDALHAIWATGAKSPRILEPTAAELAP